MRDAPRNKVDYYRRNALGEFGPTWPQWRDVADLAASGYRGPVVLRDMSTSGKTLYGVPAARLIAGDWPTEAATADRCQLSPLLPVDWCALQGEVQRLSTGLSLFYSTAHKSMKPALRENPAHAVGLEAKLLLDRYLWPSSRGDIADLLDRYDGAAIEFTALTRSLDGWPGRNTIIWEVRLY